jgi:hypothetical protein
MSCYFDYQYALIGFSNWNTMLLISHTSYSQVSYAYHKSIPSSQSMLQQIPVSPSLLHSIDFSTVVKWHCDNYAICWNNLCDHFKSDWNINGWSFIYKHLLKPSLIYWRCVSSFYAITKSTFITKINSNFPWMGMYGNCRLSPDLIQPGNM